MRILYPASLMNPAKPDDAFREEHDAAVALGFEISVFDIDSMAFGLFNAHPALRAGEQVLYRGWMLTVEQYANIVTRIEGAGAKAVVSPEAYANTHHLPRWYDACHVWTPKTVYFPNAENMLSDLPEQLVELQKQAGWERFFVKDYVKSNSSGEGSIADTPLGVVNIVKQIRQYRNMIEGGVVVRQYEVFQENTEQRWFVVDGEAFNAENSLDADVPAFFSALTARIDSPFYTVDVAKNLAGEWRVIELGDGQVSDLKEWTVNSLLNVVKKRLNVIVA